jgi:hypothetical protein
MAFIRVIQLLGAFLVIAYALAARAASDPIDARADFRPPARPAPGPNARARNGNPLWAIPLSALTATRERPLFSESRRPPIVASPIVAPPPQRQGDPAPPPPEQPSFTLVGTIVSPKASVAVLQGSNLRTIRVLTGREHAAHGGRAPVGASTTRSPTVSFRKRSASGRTRRARES